jgi:hypothetical protein
MKDYNDLINRIQDSYNKTYTEFQIKDIREYLEKRNFPIVALRNLYDLITEEEAYFPKKAKFKEIIDNALQAGSISINGGLHPESPLQQLYRAQDWTVEKILENCRRIRAKQDQIGIDKLKSAELSFLVIWEQLKDVEAEHRELAKKRIVGNGDNQLKSPADLSDLSIYGKFESVEYNRTGKTIYVGEVI